MRRVGKCVQQPLFRLRAAHFHDAPAGFAEDFQVPLRVQKWNRLGGTACGKRHEDGTEFNFKIFANGIAPLEHCPANGARPPRQDFFIRDQHEFPGPVGIFRRVQQIGFGRKRNFCKVIERLNGMGGEMIFVKQLPVVRREWKDSIAQKCPQPHRLSLTDGTLRQIVPVFPKEVHVARSFFQQAL